ncbi:hypothetical protein [Rhizobium sp. LEGMi135b]
MTGFLLLVSDKNSKTRLADGLIPWQVVRDMVLRQFVHCAKACRMSQDAAAAMSD